MKCPAWGHIAIPRDGRWSFNGNYERPTFSPSINATMGKPGQSHEEMRADPNPMRNHFFITDGQIQYLSDCTHELRGQTVNIPPLSEAEAAMYFEDKSQ